MGWVKKGLIFRPAGKASWARTHAQVPAALVLADRIRIYYAARDDEGRSRTGFVDVSRDDPAHVLRVHPDPVMELGAPGTHDEDGVMVGCVVQEGGDVLMYYTGWSRGLTVPYRVSVGLARSTDGGVTFERVFQGPVVDRTAREAFMTMSPYVLREGDLWRMWYGSGTGWVEIDGKPEPLYATKYASSTDGLDWHQDDVLCIAPLHPLEANTRPSVLKTAAGYEMWFSYRHSREFRTGGGGYRIGYATSEDGEVWRRHDDPVGLVPSGEGWDGRMCAYPNVIQVDGRTLMFHNGDGFGRTGFGYAVRED